MKISQRTPRHDRQSSKGIFVLPSPSLVLPFVETEPVVIAPPLVATSVMLTMPPDVPSTPTLKALTNHPHKPFPLIADSSPLLWYAPTLPSCYEEEEPSSP